MVFSTWPPPIETRPVLQDSVAPPDVICEVFAGAFFFTRRAPCIAFIPHPSILCLAHALQVLALAPRRLGRFLRRLGNVVAFVLLIRQARFLQLVFFLTPGAPICTFSFLVEMFAPRVDGLRLPYPFFLRFRLVSASRVDPLSHPCPGLLRVSPNITTRVFLLGRSPCCFILRSCTTRRFISIPGRKADGVGPSTTPVPVRGPETFGRVDFFSSLTDLYVCSGSRENGR